MPAKKHKPEEIIGDMFEVEILHGQGDNIGRCNVQRQQKQSTAGRHAGQPASPARVAIALKRLCPALSFPHLSRAICSRGTRFTSVQRPTMLAPRDWFPRPEH